MKRPKQRFSQAAVFATVFAVALVVRIIFVFQWNDLPYGGIPLLDAKVYDDWAQAIAQGHLLRSRAFYGSPLYPYLLGALYAVFDHSLLLAGIFNAVLGSLTAAVIAWLTCTLFGVGAALVSGAAAALYLPLVFYTAPVMKEPLGLLLLALFMVFALRAARLNRMRDLAWSGVLLGLCVLVRGNVLLLAIPVLGFGFWKYRRKFQKNAAVFVGAMVLCFLPATIHNYVVSGDFVPINYADGFNLYIGNSPIANGTNQYPPEISTDPVQEEFATIWEAREAAGHPIGPAAVSRFWRRKAIDFALHNPARELWLIKNKFMAFWNNAESFDSYDIRFIRKNFDTIVSGPLMFPFWPISLLAAFGAVLAWHKHRRDVAVIGIMAGVYMFSVMMFYVADRYRLPIVIFMLPLMGAAFPYGWKLFRAKDWKPLASAGAAAVVFLVLAFWPPTDDVDLTAFDWGTLSTVYFDLGEDQETLDALDKAIEISAKDAGAQAFVRASLVEQSRGQEVAAEKILRDAMRLYPQDGVLEYNYGRFKAMRGDLRGAIVELNRAMLLSPTYLLNYYALAKIYERLDDRKRALDVAREGLKIDPSDARLLEVMAELQA